MIAADNLFALRPAGTHAPVICFPPASGSPAAYRLLSALLPEGSPVYGFSSPGFEDDRQPPVSVHKMADEYADAFHRLSIDPPYRLVGWSMGAILAFETLRRISDGQDRGDVLILIDPPIAGPCAVPAEVELAERFLADFTSAEHLQGGDPLRSTPR